MHGTTIKKKLKQHARYNNEEETETTMHGTTIKKRLKKQCMAQQ
jgi:hypothetical protein